VFETSASTNSATWAYWACKCNHLFESAQIILKQPANVTCQRRKTWQHSQTCQRRKTWQRWTSPDLAASEATWQHW